MAFIWTCFPHVFSFPFSEPWCVRGCPVHLLHPLHWKPRSRLHHSILTHRAVHNVQDSGRGLLSPNGGWDQNYDFPFLCMLGFFAARGSGVGVFPGRIGFSCLLVARFWHLTLVHMLGSCWVFSFQFCSIWSRWREQAMQTRLGYIRNRKDSLLIIIYNTSRGWLPLSGGALRVNNGYFNVKSFAFTP